MNIGKEIIFLLKKELLLEWRQKYALSGIILYVFSTVFIVYYTVLNELPKAIWNALFWIIVLFASVNAVAKSFIQENSNRQLYYYTLANPIAIILSKIIYNAILLLFLTFLSFAVFSFVMVSPVQNYGQFFLALFLGGLGFSITFTFISAIASKANNSSTLMAILGFPLIIPILMLLIKLSQNAIFQNDSAASQDVMMLVAIDLILVAMSFILFPYLWRD